MPSLDIPVSVDLQAMLDVPPCADLKLPSPSPLKLTLPTGATLQAINDISKGIPNDCSMSINLLIQLAPFLASMECLLKVLKLLGPLIEVIKGLPFPPVEAIAKFVEAAADLTTCLQLPLPATNLFNFIRDILCLILKILRCLLGQLKTIAELLGGLAINIKLAADTGNTELLNSLECAQENALTSAEHLAQSMEMITAILGLVAPFMEIAQIPPIKLPALGSQTDVAAINETVEVLETVVQTIETVVEALPGGSC